MTIAKRGRQKGERTKNRGAGAGRDQTEQIAREWPSRRSGRGVGTVMERKEKRTTRGTDE